VFLDNDMCHLFHDNVMPFLLVVAQAKALTHREASEVQDFIRLSEGTEVDVVRDGECV
jgi:hypothetical protein